jgi:hypothetical protein
VEADRVAKEQADAAAAATAAAEAERVAKEQADAAAAAEAEHIIKGQAAPTPERVEAERVAKEERLQYWNTYLEEQKVAVAAQEEADRVANEQAESERVSKERTASETTAKEDRLKYWKKFLEEQSAKPSPRPVAIQQVAAPVQAPASSVQRPKSRFLRNAVVPSFKHIGGL